MGFVYRWGWANLFEKCEAHLETRISLAVANEIGSLTKPVTKRTMVNFED